MIETFWGGENAEVASPDYVVRRQGCVSQIREAELSRFRDDSESCSELEPLEGFSYKVGACRLVCSLDALSELLKINPPCCEADRSLADLGQPCYSFSASCEFQITF